MTQTFLTVSVLEMTVNTINIVRWNQFRNVETGGEGSQRNEMVHKEAGDRIRFKLSLADQVGAAFHQNASLSKFASCLRPSGVAPNLRRNFWRRLSGRMIRQSITC